MSATPRSGPPLPAEHRPWWPVLAVAALAVAGLLRSSPAARTSQGDLTAAAGGQKPSAAEGRPASKSAERGREADSPVDIPLPGWKDILWRVYGGIGDDRLLAVAAGVTFYALLAIFPAIAALVSLYGLIADPSTIGKQLESLNGILPEGAIAIVGEQVKRLTATPGGSLSFALVISLGISLWSANAGMKAVFDALNVAYREKEERSFVWLNLRSLAFTFGAILVLILAMVLVVVLPVVLNTIPFGNSLSVLLSVARWPLMLAVIVGGLSVLYRYGPSRAAAQWRWIVWGSALAAVLWMAASMLFSLYVSRFGSYNATYGSLGSAVGFMTWMWISTVVVLIGAEFSGEMEHQTRKDTTTGAPEPEGARGAVMADEVGASA